MNEEGEETTSVVVSLYVPECSSQVDPGENMYSGVSYASRFFVARVGFLRSIKRILALSDSHLSIIDPYTDEVKEKYTYKEVKEITLSSDQSTDRSFTLSVGKTKDTYTCRNRQQFLSAYYELSERARVAEDQDGTDQFDNVFRLCGQSFSVLKLSSTRRYVVVETPGDLVF